MANKNNKTSEDLKNENIQLENIEAYSEDENGYVNTDGNKISLDTLSRLPSRNIDGLFGVDKSTVEVDGSDVRYTLSQRNIRYNSLRFKRATLSCRSLNVGVNNMYELLVEDPTCSKVNQLRDMHQTLTLKRLVKNKLDSEIRRETNAQILDGYTRCKLRTSLCWQGFIRRVNLSAFFALWRDKINTVEGHFGSGVASYFILLRWLLYLNCANFFLTFCFVVIPQLIFDGTGEVAHHVNVTFRVQDLLTGQGWLTDTIFYFGHYTNTTRLSFLNADYQMTSAYLCTLGVNVLVGLVALLYSLTSTYDANFLESSSAIPHAFSDKIFSGWDYSVQTADAAYVRKQCTYKELQELLSKKYPIKIEETMLNQVFLMIFRIVLNIFIFSLIAGIGYLIYFLLNDRALETSTEILKYMSLSLTVTSLSMVFYYVLKFLTKIEYFHTKKNLFYITICRVILLKSVMIGIIVYFWLAIYAPNYGRNVCYESLLGAELYRLMLVNFFLDEIVSSFFGEYLRRVLIHRFFPLIGLAQFDVAYNVLDLIYYQALVWIGAFSTPILSFLAMIVLVLHFYLKFNSVMRNCQPSRNAWTASQAKAFFLSLALIIFLLTEFVVYYIIFVIPPSYCGPLKNYDSSVGALKDTFKYTSYPVLDVTLNYISSSGFSFTIIMGLCVALYFVRENAIAYRKLIRKLQHQLVLIGKDKVFLLKLFDAALREKRENSASTQSPRQVIYNDLYDHDYDLQPPPSGTVLERCDPGYMAAMPRPRKSIDRPELPVSPHKKPFRYLVEGKPLPDRNRPHQQ